MSTRFGIVGTGMIAHFHAKAIQAMPGGQVVACFNQNVDKANAFAAEYGCKAYSTLDELLADPNVGLSQFALPAVLTEILRLLQRRPENMWSWRSLWRLLWNAAMTSSTRVLSTA